MYTLRPADTRDRPHLTRVYASTRTEELARTNWTQEQKDSFVLMQFEAQDAHYRAHYDGAHYMVIEVEGSPAGRLYLHWRDEELRIMDIALLPEFRARGVGSSVLRELMAKASRSGRRTSIHVEKFNPAMRLYERLGFVPVSDRGVYLLMEHQPNTAP